jgi:GDP-mannose 6-dehydrogenase
MNIAIFGLGYVGIVSAACFSRDGHHVVGVDINPKKVESIRSGRSPIIEPGLEELINKGVSDGRLQATGDAGEALSDADLAIVCVGTPSKGNGSLDRTYVERVCKEIGTAIRTLEQRVEVVVRSTMLPGSSSHLIDVLENGSGKKVGEDFGFVVNPEFLREGSAISDFEKPPFTVIGETDQAAGAKVQELYSKLDAPIFHVPLGTAEMVKYASNAFHALKVVFANEIGNICQAYGVDSHNVMEIFIQDDKLNLSPYYLKPGFSFGGSCLGKDLRALLYSAQKKDIDPAVLASILPSNQAQTQKAVDMVLKEAGKRVGILGLSFKQKTDDLRESPAVEMVERLIGKGFEIKIFDREVSMSRIHGSNREYIERSLPHIGALLQESLEEVIGDSEIVIVTKSLQPDELSRMVNSLNSGQTVIDLVRLPRDTIQAIKGKYRGIAW